MTNIFLAYRFIRSKNTSGFISFITFISVSGIAIGVAALIIAVSVLNGFEKEITNKTISLSSHIQLTSFKKEGIPDYKKIITELSDTNNNFFVKKAYPFIQKEAVIKFKDNTEGIILKGIREEDNIFGEQRRIINGSDKFSSQDSLNNGIIIGNKLAKKLNINTSDKVFLIATIGLPSASNTPTVKGFKVIGIYESGLKEYDDVLVYISLTDAAKLFSMGPYVTGIEIFLLNNDKIKTVTNEIKTKIDYPNNNARNVFQIYKGLFTWVELQKEPIPIILGLIIIVAAINIIGFLLMLVLEKTQTIGILKSLGAKNTDIISIFFIQGMIISLTGILIGNLLGYGLCYLQAEYNIITIPEIYYMSTVPLEISLNTGILITIIAIVLSILVTVIPSYMASRLSPITSLRFK
jgi:lipoprotein-releasing system permease protein